MSEAAAPQANRSIPIWRDERFIRIIVQVISAAAVLGGLAWLINNVLQAADQRGLSLDFAFLRDAAGFPLSESPIPYDPSRSFAYAFWVGILNTLQVSLAGILLATLVGLVVGVSRLSSNWLVSRLALAYIEFHRNIPLLVLLFIWYLGVFTQLPRVQESLSLGGQVFINQRGLYLPAPVATSATPAFLVAAGAGLVLAAALWIGLRRAQLRTGRRTYYAPAALAAALFSLALGWLLAGGQPFEYEIPYLQGFNFRAGLRLSPEFTALLIGLVTYTAAFIAEAVRAGIQAVNRGQLEAARAVGLKPGQVLSLIVFPQALRVIVPPLISQYLNLIKNSSLAIFIGFPELFFIGKTTSNQAGRALQVILLVMGVYLVISLITSLFLNWYNRRIQFIER